jgi:hypothetical protein
MLVKNTSFLLPNQPPNLAYIPEEVTSTDGVPNWRGSRGKRDLDHIILNYGYLADKELGEMLIRILGAGYFDSRNKEMVPRMIELIESGYTRLRKECFAEDG